MCETNFIIFTSPQSFDLSFRCYSMLFLPLYLRFHLDSCITTLIRDIFCISTQIPRIPTLILRTAFPSHSSHFHPYSPHFPHSVLQFSILAFTDSLLSLYSLRIYFRKIVALVQKWTLPFLLLHNSRHQIIIYIIYEVISLSPKIIYLIEQVKNP